jgi:hypothetical protein
MASTPDQALQDLALESQSRGGELLPRDGHLDAEVLPAQSGGVDGGTAEDRAFDVAMQGFQRGLRRALEVTDSVPVTPGKG